MKFLVLFIFCVISFEMNAYTFQLNCKKLDEGSNLIYLKKNIEYEQTLSGKYMVSDSCEIIENKIVFKNLLPNTLYTIFYNIQGVQSIIINGVDNNYIHFMSNGEDISCSADLNQLTISAKFINPEKDNLLTYEFNNYYIKCKYFEKMKELKSIITSGKKFNQSDIVNDLKAAYKIDSLFYSKLLKKTNSDVFATFLIYCMNYETKSNIGLKKLYKSKANIFKNNSEYVKSFQKYYENEISNYSVADFKLNLYNDFITNVNIDTIKQRYILFDVWASWCLPCRQEIKTNILPNLNNENIKVIGLNIDENISLANTAILKDNYKTIHFFCKDGKNSKFLKTLNVKSIPRYILLDKVQNRLIRNFDIFEFKKYL